MAAERVTIADIDAKLRGLHGETKARIVQKKQTLLPVLGAAGFLILVLMYLLGRRSGKKKTTFVEIRRV